MSARTFDAEPYFAIRSSDIKVNASSDCNMLSAHIPATRRHLLA